VQIWVTEFGWPTWEGYSTEPPEVFFTYNSAEQQGWYTIRALEIGQQLDYVGPMFVWNLNFANETLIQQRHEIAGYSIITPLTPPERPLFSMLHVSLNPED
ncbi:MAG: hypothetical protein D6712_00835, partial [Chloroflexi bacterium]